VAGTLIICATPIGNLDDASPRLREALASAAVVYAEDTRRSKTLLDALGVDRPLRSYFVGNEDARAHELGERLAAGEVVALVSDAGMPGVADPGLSAVRAALRAGATVTVVPGPSAVTAALAVSGLPSDRFVFEGFLARRGKDRAAALERIAAEERTVVLFAAKRRVADDLADLAGACGPDRPVAVVRELTKLHEEVWRGDLRAAVAHWTDVEQLGEFTLVVGGGVAAQPDLGRALDEVFARIEAGTSLTSAVREVATATGTPRRRLYEAAIRRRDG
jgi:16S rRNA (cytidine1402-2'-O)-methyltransferase